MDDVEKLKKIASATKYPIVKILWVDAATDNSWQSKDDLEKEGVGNPTITIGFLVRKPTKKFPMYIVASTYDPDTDHFNATIRIPKVWVKSVEEINEQPRTE